MSKYIDELTELICDTVRTVFPNASLDDGYDVADEVIAKLPTIEVSEGEWLKRDVCEYRCANCGKIQFADCDHELNYCCNCGSRNKWKGKYIDRDSDEGVRNE